MISPRDYSLWRVSESPPSAQAEGSYSSGDRRTVSLTENPQRVNGLKSALKKNNNRSEERGPCAEQSKVDGRQANKNHYYQGAAAERKGNWEGALAHYGESLSLAKRYFPDDIASYHQLIGKVYQTQGKSDLALQSYTQALRLREIRVRESKEEVSRLVVLYERIAGIYEHQGKLNKALEFYNHEYSMIRGFSFPKALSPTEVLADKIQKLEQKISQPSRSFEQGALLTDPEKKSRPKEDASGCSCSDCVIA